ncbi:N-ethylmaleimide reductase [Erwinia tracheiphila PSU-1]|nr:N-ethylmaleimide reductase [Erwinia tracheiphila PSU-1]
MPSPHTGLRWREKRTRFALEVVDTAISGWGADRMGSVFHRCRPFNGPDNGDDQKEAALYYIGELAKRNLAYLYISEPDWAGGKPYSEAFRKAIRATFPGVIVGAGSYTAAKAESLIEQGLTDAVAPGRTYITNPDLVERLQYNASLNGSRPAFFYGCDAHGYTDYPALGAK